MKVLVLGGAGGMGRVAVEQTASYPFVEHVTVTDLDGVAATAVAQRVGSKAKGMALDINDRALMRETIIAHDLVLNCVGPFYVLGLPVLEQVIEAGRNYADICDDWEPTLDMLALSHRAEEKGVVALVGLGASPGVSNMLAMKAASMLDSVEEVITGWSIDGSGEDISAVVSSHPKVQGASAALVHWVQQMTGTIRVLKEGGYQQVKPLVRSDIFYPGYGSLPVWSVGHPEAVTLPRVLPGLMACTNVMVGGEDGFLGLQVLAGLVDTGVLTIHQAADEIAKDFAKKTETGKSPKPLAAHAPGLFGWARGNLRGKPTVAAAHVLSLPPGGMAGATSVPLSLAVPLFQQGFDERVGVFSPEELINPVAFFDLLAPRCSGHFSSGEALVAIDVAQLDA